MNPNSRNEKCPECGCPVSSHNAVNRVDANPFGGELLVLYFPGAFTDSAF
jgi:hypothetical protein